MNWRYRVTEESSWGTVSIHWTNDLHDAIEWAERNPLRQIYDEGEKCWVPLGLVAARAEDRS